ncbi:pupal cuticle protein PCP52-like [Maniola jurtina]|uniref:pupal cuticle protein PCP52-like n=1 Tax=Maniola jurtina TaxID=191418 RepID=UPI001E68FA98|nr:pupal cuticle protein PCP52-like [Maniola jurtina]
MAPIKLSKSARFLLPSALRLLTFELFLLHLCKRAYPEWSLFYIQCGWNIKTHRDQMKQSVDIDIAKMRVLIVSAFLACASAAPSVLNFVPYTAFPLTPGSPYAALSVAPVPVAPIVAPEVPAGDIQAAAIDAQVKAADEAQARADKARELQEQAAENIDEGVAEANDITKEKSEEAFWASEEMKNQALNEAQIAEARLAAEAAKEIAMPESAEEKSEIKSEATEAKTEEKMELKAEEAEKPVEAEMKEAEKKDDAVEVKAAAPEAPKPGNPFGVYNSIFPAPIPVAPGLNFQPYVAPISYQAAYRTPFPVATFPHIYQPAIAIKHAW